MKRFLQFFLAAVLTAGFLWLCIAAGEKSRETPQETVPVNVYTPGDFYWEDGFLVCAAGNAVMGVDVSYHQQEIDWQKLKEAGVEFAMIRLGNRGISTGDLREDPMARRNLQEAKAAGIRIGAYFYSQAISVEEAREEAALAVQILDGMALDLPLAYDWELERRTETVDKETLTACTAAFCEMVKASGYRPMVYFNSYQAEELLELSELTQYPWWLAMYDTEKSFPWRMDMWQYTSEGSLPGIEGNVDINLLFTDYGLGAELG